ncbi:hypothetical protein HAHE_25750 [Haloferula helveola]|uniref:Sialate O-acetylesterase domain-containing protein n=1 Tax=Haloferula helveola TaxID=490095 RepID=A0ABM7RGZ3_9BACT|nr:hypothetical protein HAHE_25750 [Haloferula helveola]
MKKLHVLSSGLAALCVSTASAGLLAHYPFDSDFTDSTGASNDLTAGNGTPVITNTVGEYVFGGGALDLSRAESEWLAPTTDFSFSTSDSWTVSFWAKRRAGAAAPTGMVVGDNTTTDSFIWLPDNSSVVQGLRFRPVGVGTSNNNDYSTGHDTDFHHWVVIADGTGTIRVYRDNADLGTRTPSGGSDFDIKAVGSGYTGSNQIFDGQIDELYIFDEALDVATVGELFSGSYGATDSTPPTLVGSDIVDGGGGAAVIENGLVTYTVTFSEEMTAPTVDTTDFGDAGTSGVNILSVTQVSPAVFEVLVSPTSTGTLQLQVNPGAVLTDGAGNALDTASAIIDDTSIQVDPGAVLPGVIGYYSFDSGFGDDSGNGNHLVVGDGTPTITTTAGEHVFGGGALDLDSATSNQEFLDLISPLSFGASDPWSVSFWVRRRAGSDDRQGMVLGDTTNTTDFIWATNSTSQVQGLRFRDDLGGNADFGDYPDDGSYHHWVVISDGAGTITAYRDNVAQTDVFQGGAFAITSVGHAYSATTFSMNGQIDELYIFDNAIDSAKVNELFTGVPDTDPPTLSAGGFVDDQSGGPVLVGDLVTYTVTFSEDMDDSTVTAADFGNAGSSTLSIGAVIETSPGVFTVEVTPTSAGTLQLQVNVGAVLADPSGNELDTLAAIADATVITVDSPDTTPPTLGAGDFSDDQGGGPVTVGTTVTFTISFSEDMDESTVDAADFGNAGTATISIGAISEVSPGVFTVEVTPTTAGTLQLEVVASATLDDAAGNPLDTGSAITSATSITVEDLPGPADIRRIHVFLLGGQSNADGRADPSGLPTSPVDLQQPQADVDFYENEAGGLTTLRPLSQFGPEVTLGRKLADNLGGDPDTRVAIIKYASGGTDLYSDWVAGGDATTTGDGPLYVGFQNVVTAGLSALASAYPNAVIEVSGMLWVQGERDAGSSEAANYETNLTNFIADIRLTYGSGLWFVVSRLSSGQTAVNAGGLATVRAAQDAVAAADSLTALLDTDGFGMKTDNLHFDATGQQQIGNGAAMWLLDFWPFLEPLEFTPQPGGGFEIVVNQAFDGFVYTLEGNPDLQPVNWAEIETLPPTGSSVTFSHTPAPGADREFYRVTRAMAP